MVRDKFILDVDPGVDDIAALVLAIKSKLNIKLITTIGGNVDIKYVTTNAKYVVDLMNEKISIGKGVNKPLWDGKRLDASSYHGKYGAGKMHLVADISEVGNAVEMMYNALKKDKLSIIALGPLTNIALLLERYPEIKPQIKKIYSMGCTYNGTGSHMGWGEFNYVWDPIAVLEVAQSGIPLILCPTEVARMIPIKHQEMKKFAKDKPADKLILDVYDGIFDNKKTDEIYIHDVFVIDYILNPTEYIIKKCDIWINLDKNSEFFGLTKATINQNGKYSIVYKPKSDPKNRILEALFK